MTAEIQMDIIAKYQEILAYIPTIISKRPHQTIYHYTSAQGLAGILQSQKIWLTRWDCLNDSSEYLQIHDTIKRCIKKYRHAHDFYKTIEEWNELSRIEKQKKFYDEDNYDLYIASFSDNNDALNMWTYYTKSSKSDGYCIGFKPQNIFSDKVLDLSIHKVFYRQSEKNQIVKKLLDKLYDFYCFAQSRPSVQPFHYQYFISNYINVASAYIGCFFKHSSFAVENEIRAALFIRQTKDNTPLTKKSRISQGIIIPYTELLFQKEDIESITVSPTLPKLEATAGLQFLRDQLGYKFRIEHSAIPLRNI